MSKHKLRRRCLPGNCRQAFKRQIFIHHLAFGTVGKIFFSTLESNFIKNLQQELSKFELNVSPTYTVTSWKVIKRIFLHFFSFNFTRKITKKKKSAYPDRRGIHLIGGDPKMVQFVNFRWARKKNIWAGEANVQSKRRRMMFNEWISRFFCTFETFFPLCFCANFSVCDSSSLLESFVHLRIVLKSAIDCYLTRRHVSGVFDAFM